MEGLIVVAIFGIIAAIYFLRKKPPEEPEPPAPVCKPGETECRGLDFYVCNSQGQWKLSEKDSPYCLEPPPPSQVDMIFKVSTWIGKWRTTWEDGQQILVPTYKFGQVNKVGINAYYFGGPQIVEQQITYPDGHVETRYTAGWQGPRCCYQDRKYCYTYSLPGFRPTQPGVYYGKIRIRTTKIPNPDTGEYSYGDEVNLILLKLLPE